MQPLLDAGRRRDQTIRNMNYTVHVHLDQQATFGDQVVPIHNVETVSTSERQLPSLPTGGFWISAARTDAALREEFGRPGCLARELVDLRDDAGVPLEGQRWLDAVQQLCRVVVTINGQVQDVQFVVDEATDIVRWRFSPEAAEIEQRVPVQVAFDFPVSASTDRFPVMFSSYYCAGSTVVSLKLYGLPADQLIRCDSFFARGLGPQSGTGELVRAQGALSQQVSFSTGRNSLLWPGSGVLFDWHAC